MATLNLREENIYAAGYIVELEDGKSILKNNPLEYSTAVSNDITHTLKQDEKLWNIAYKYYGNSKWWHVIAIVNKLSNPFDIPIGTELIIPDLDVIRALRK